MAANKILNNERAEGSGLYREREIFGGVTQPSAITKYKTKNNL